MVFAEKIQGQEGKIMLRPMGAMIGYFSHWLLSSPDKKTYTFTGTLGYINPKLWDYGARDGYERRVTLRIGKDKTYQLCAGDDATIEIVDRELRMERVTLCLPEGR